MASSAASFLARRDGNLAVLFALLLPVVLLFAGGGLDFQRRYAQQSRLQEYVDTLALRGAREFLLANADAAQIKSLVKATAESGLAERYGAVGAELDVRVDDKVRMVTVTLRQKPETALTAAFAPPLKRPLEVDAVATASGGSNVCVIALDQSSAGAVDAQFGSKLDAGECAIISNSTSSAGVRASGVSKLTASMICSAGGYQGPGSAFSQAPVTDCPPLEDPLSAREPPPVGPCDHQDFMVGSRDADTFKQAVVASLGEFGGTTSSTEMTRKDYVVDPGVYCGGLIVGSNASVTFNPGVYVIRDGVFSVDLNGAIKGEGVSFHLAGDNSTFVFNADSKIELSAPKDGLLAGILFYEDRTSKARTHAILSNDARTLLGTFYLPKSTLFVSTISPVADKSAYTAIVARRLSMAGGPTLVLNADYALTDVPVPDGVGPVGGEVFLRE